MMGYFRFRLNNYYSDTEDFKKIAESIDKKLNETTKSSDEFMKQVLELKQYNDELKQKKNKAISEIERLNKSSNELSNKFLMATTKEEMDMISIEKQDIDREIAYYESIKQADISRIIIAKLSEVIEVRNKAMIENEKLMEKANELKKYYEFQESLMKEARKYVSLSVSDSIYHRAKEIMREIESEARRDIKIKEHNEKLKKELEEQKRDLNYETKFKTHKRF